MILSDVRVEPGVLRQAVTPTTLHLILLPTEACNFRCTYCYEDFRLGKMEPWVVAGLKKLMEARAPGLERLDLSWFGGEPLLAREVVLDLLEHANALASAQPGLVLASEMTTNGWHLELGLFTRLVQLGVDRFQISFDGPEEIHDRKRRKAGGQPTFAHIWGNLLRLREAEGKFEIRIRIHVDRENLGHVSEFLASCREAFGEDRRFVVVPKLLRRYGGENDASLPVFEDEAEGQRALQSLRSESGRGVTAAGDGAFQEMCYASKANSFLVRADGRLGKCTVALGDPRNDIGRIHPDGRVEIDSERIAPWMRGLSSGRQLELLCPLAGLA